MPHTLPSSPDWLYLSYRYRIDLLNENTGRPDDRAVVYMTNYSSVIIDFDGTLFDTRRAISVTLRETFGAYNVPPPSRERVGAL
jgi:hypothetical protein